MFDFDVGRFLLTKGPLSASVAVSAVFLPSSLLVFLTRPDLYDKYGLAGGIFFGAAIGLPMLVVCSLPWYVLLGSAAKLEHLKYRAAQAIQGKAVEQEAPPVAEAVNRPDPFEWPGLVVGGWVANLVLYGLAARAYYHPLRLGATLLLTVSILVPAWIVLIAALNAAVGHVEKGVQAVEEKARAAAIQRR